jgi:hypothetical protein
LQKKKVLQNRFAVWQKKVMQYKFRKGNFAESFYGVALKGCGFSRTVPGKTIGALAPEVALKILRRLQNVI